MERASVPEVSLSLHNSLGSRNSHCVKQINFYLSGCSCLLTVAANILLSDTFKEALGLFLLFQGCGEGGERERERAGEREGDNDSKLKSLNCYNRKAISFQVTLWHLCGTWNPLQQPVLQ